MSWNTGSIVEEVSKRISNIPTGISGTNMNSIVEGAMYTVQNTTGHNPGSVDIDQKYNEVLVCLTGAKVAQTKEMDSDSDSSLGGGKGYTIGDFKFQGNNYATGDGSVIDSNYKKWLACAEKELRMLGFKAYVEKANG